MFLGEVHGTVVRFTYFHTEIFDKEEADGIVELGLSGEMTDKAFEHIRENFTSLETIDMSAIENSEIPSNAFAGMENLTNVVIPENVTSIGKNAFAGCSQLVFRS